MCSTSKVTCGITVSVDGDPAGLDQTEQRPFGADGGDGWGSRLHAWFADTPEENRVEIDQIQARGGRADRGPHAGG